MQQKQPLSTSRMQAYPMKLFCYTLLGSCKPFKDESMHASQATFGTLEKISPLWPQRLFNYYSKGLKHGKKWKAPPIF